MPEQNTTTLIEMHTENSSTTKFLFALEALRNTTIYYHNHDLLSIIWAKKDRACFEKKYYLAANLVQPQKTVLSRGKILGQCQQRH